MKENAGKEKLLVVDDSVETLEVIQRNLMSMGYTVFTAQNVFEAVNFLESNHVDLVITDLKMPRISGIDLVKHVRENLRDTEVMMITGYATIEGAVEAVKAGAQEYLPKPFTDKELSTAVRRSLDKLNARIASDTEVSARAKTPYGLLGESEPMKFVYSAIVKAASTSATVLISGESGTGKELVARAIHYSSNRASAPFVPVNCGGIPEGLLESELFGYVKGAFTSATETRAGFFQTADGGTIFLDEISETSIAMQVKLLRVLQEKEVCMVGDNRTRSVDVRVVAATNKNLAALIEKELFREDFYFRINVVNIDLPPLRDRGNDVCLLIWYFTSKYANELGKKKPSFSDNALEVLRNYHWPGNVRELENVIQRIVVMNDDDVVDVRDLPSLMRFSALRGTGVQRSLAEVEAGHINNVLADAGGNKTKAAKILGIDRKTLREKIKRYNLNN